MSTNIYSSFSNSYNTVIGKDINQAKSFLQNGELVAIPTETVYGLAANAFDEKAVQSIFTTKGRPQSNPLILHVSNIEQVRRYVTHIPEKAMTLLKCFSPGPITLLLPKSNLISDSITAGSHLVAIRIPNHPLTLQLLESLPFPLVAPSANLYQQISPTTAQHVYAGLSNKIPYILDGGPCQAGIESTIIGFTPNSEPDYSTNPELRLSTNPEPCSLSNSEQPTIYRLGALSIEKITELIGLVSLFNKSAITPAPTTNTTSTTTSTTNLDSTPTSNLFLASHSHPITPGMAIKHYSPQTALIVVDDFDSLFKEDFQNQNQNQNPNSNSNSIVKDTPKDKIAYLGYNQFHPGIPNTQQYLLCLNNDFETAAHNLYKALHDLDQGNYQLIVVKRFPNQGLGLSINDRIQRAQNS